MKQLNNDVTTQDSVQNNDWQKQNKMLWYTTTKCQANIRHKAALVNSQNTNLGPQKQKQTWEPLWHR